MRLPVVLLALSLPAVTAVPAHALCFTIYNERNVVLYQSTEPPVDLSRRIGTEMARRYPRHFLVMAESNVGCVPIQGPGFLAQRAGASAGPTWMDAPLFRDAPTGASALNADATGSYGATSRHSPVASSGRSPGTDVDVDAYTRSDGTVVRSHTRSAPGGRR